MCTVLVMRHDLVVQLRHTHTAHKEYFALQWKYFSKPLQMLVNGTNQIASYEV